MEAKATVSEYVQKHQVFQLFEELLQQLIIYKPDDPLDFLIQYLGTSHGKWIYRCIFPFFERVDMALFLL